MSDPEQIRAAKAALRKRLHGARLGLDPAAVQAASSEVCALVLLLPAFARARRVAFYAALPGEIDAAPLAQALRGRGGEAYFPRIEKREPPLLSFHRVDDPAQLEATPWGIPTPPAQLPRAGPDGLELFLVPGLAFDPRGGRLGFGRGFYDAALLAFPSALRLALGHSFQLLDALPLRPEDQPMDLIATPLGVHETHARSR